ncbi:Xrcc4-like factor 1 [Madurella mycetomatis]|uniref:Non-homologous end-joining factor 1 n=1 Tax=Madurella mycetomatis TaxID=100816 RepID=A0A175WB04_9PEZI|nr:Xrcc4-like factor 1 [Madurella mycetomatis]
MSSHPSWRLLPAAAPNIPDLLVSTAFAADSYSVHLTDLANIWVESMDRRAIIKRGLVEDTSIDPSDGPDQIRKMLEFLRASFDVRDPEHPNTSLTLASADDGGSLVINVTCVLPKPLKPFKWPMHLKKCPQSTVATELVLPLIQAHEARVREVGELIRELRDKDSVINRLVDKLEIAGTGLEHIFSSLSGKRKVSRAAAEERVNGLAPFSEAEFRGKAADLRPVAQSSDVSALLDAVFGAPGLRYKSSLELEASISLNDWWAKLGNGENVILSRRSGTRETGLLPLPQEYGTGDDEDDFQVQSTPPGLMSARNRGDLPRSMGVDDDETSDGEDVAEASALSPSPKRDGAASREGTLDRRSRPSTSPLPMKPPKAATTEATTADSHSETASEPDKDAVGGSPPQPPSKHPPTRLGLGRIGGSAKQETTTTMLARSPSPSAQRDDHNTPPRRHKLGIIGKKKASPVPAMRATSASEDDRGRSKAPACEPKKEPERETSLERADRKRAELQKDLEKRAAAGPAKKKRKF